MEALTAVAVLYIEPKTQVFEALSSIATEPSVISDLYIFALFSARRFSTSRLCAEEKSLFTRKSFPLLTDSLEKRRWKEYEGRSNEASEADHT